jgi:enediyne polyketide synthase
LLLPTDDTYSNFVGNVYFSHIIALAERTCHQALRQLDRGVSGFYATSLQLTHLGEAMPGAVLEALVHLSEVGTKSCTFFFTITNNSHGDSTIATGWIRYHRFAMPPALPTEPLPMPCWLLPASNGLKTNKDRASFISP